MALAATENANVWTSVRSRYLVVASTRPERRSVRGGGFPEAGPGFADVTTAGVTLAGAITAAGTIVGGRVDTSFLLNRSRVPGFRRMLPEPKFRPVVTGLFLYLR